MARDYSIRIISLVFRAVASFLVQGSQGGKTPHFANSRAKCSDVGASPPCVRKDWSYIITNSISPEALLVHGPFPLIFHQNQKMAYFFQTVVKR
jgi:hypothetical protein